VRFVSLRRRTAALLRHITTLDPATWQVVTLDRDGDYRKPQVVDEDATLSAYPGTIRQLVVRGLGHDAPTVIITNDRRSSSKQLIERYAQRATLSSAWPRPSAASTSTRCRQPCPQRRPRRCPQRARRCGLRQPQAPPARLCDGHPDTLQRRFLSTGGLIRHRGDTIVVRLDRRTYSPVLRRAHIPHVTVPWWGDRQLRFEYA
jgi:hypothetical protein